jgi:hypothetical protein
MNKKQIFSNVKLVGRLVDCEKLTAENKQKDAEIKQLKKEIEKLRARQPD